MLQLKNKIQIAGVSFSDFRFNFALVSVFTVLSKLVNLAILGYPAKVLGPENYGIYGYAVSIVAYMSIVLLPGLSNWGAREIALKPILLPRIFSEVFFLKVFLSLLAYLGLVLICFASKASEKEVVTILIYGLSVFTTAINFEWVFNGLQKMRIPAFVNFIQAILALVFTLVIVNDKEDLVVYSFIYPVCGLINVFVQFFFLRRYEIKFVRVKLYSIKEVLKKAYLLGISSSLIILLHYFNNLIIKYFLGPSSLAIYMVSFFFVEVLSTIPTVFSTIFQTRLAKNFGQNKKKALFEAKLFAEIHIILSFLFSAILFSVGPLIISLFFGDKYVDSYLIIKIMSIAIIFNYAIFGYTNCLISFGQDKFFLSIIIVSCITAVTFGTLLTSIWGVVGAAFAIILTDLIPFLYSLKYYKRATGDLYLNIWIYPILGFISTISFSIFFDIQFKSLLANIVLVVLVYLVIISFRLSKIRKSLSNGF